MLTLYILAGLLLSFIWESDTDTKCGPFITFISFIVVTLCWPFIVLCKIWDRE